MIYFAKVDDRVWVGYTNCIAKRFSTYGKRAKFLFAVDGDRVREREMHEMLRSYHRYQESSREEFEIPDDKIEELKAFFREEPGFTDVFPRKVGMTVYLNPTAHAALKGIAEDNEMQIKWLLLESVNLVLQRYGKKPVA